MLSGFILSQHRSCVLHRWRDWYSQSGSIPELQDVLQYSDHWRHHPGLVASNGSGCRADPLVATLAMGSALLRSAASA